MRIVLFAAAGFLASVQAHAGVGLLGNYYQNVNVTSVADALSATRTLTPTSTFIANAVCFPSCGGNISDGLSLNDFLGGNASNVSANSVTNLSSHVLTLNGFLNIGAASAYNFSLGSDDGSQLFIDGALAVNDDSPHPFTVQSNTINLTAGHHSIEIVQFEDGGNTGLTALINGSPIGSANSTTTTTPTPEPAALALFGLGFGALGLRARRRAV